MTRSSASSCRIVNLSNCHQFRTGAASSHNIHYQGPPSNASDQQSDRGAGDEQLIRRPSPNDLLQQQQQSNRDYALGVATRLSLSWLTLLSTLLCTILLLLATYYQSIRIAELTRHVNELRSVTRSLQLSNVYVTPGNVNERTRRSIIDPADIDKKDYVSIKKGHHHRGDRKKFRRLIERGLSFPPPTSGTPETPHSLLRFSSGQQGSNGGSQCTCVGMPGPKGDRGDKGDKGSRPILPSFITELAGPQGLKGEPGEPGPRGDRGPKGDSGKDCCDIEMVMRSKPNLLANLQGPPGEKGDKGDMGMSGRPGERANGIDQRMMEDLGYRIKNQVLQSVNQTVCLPGPQGPPGLKGDKGDSGMDGKMGPKGDKGPRGRRGFKGEQGAPGLDAPCPIGPDGLPLSTCYAYYPPLGSSSANGNGNGNVVVSAPSLAPVPNGSYKTVIVHPGQPSVSAPDPPTGPPAIVRLP